MASSSTDPTEAEEEAEAQAAAAERMASVQRGFAAAKEAGVSSAARLMKELRAVCLAGNFEVDLVDDSLLTWEVRLYEWSFDDACPLHTDLAALSREADDLVAVVLRLQFPNDFPFAPPLVYVNEPVLSSDYIFDGALCMEMLVDWQPQYGNVESMLVQISAFLAMSNARVASAATDAQRAAAKEGAAKAYKNLKEYHQKKGWGSQGAW